MGFANIPLDAATVMVAGITIGIAVDDTVHILCTYQAAMIGDIGVASGLRTALTRVGTSITATTMTSLAGFFVLLRSDFVPLQRFGLIAGTAMIVAWAADVFVLPATLVLITRSDRAIQSRGVRRDTEEHRAQAAKLV
jgi:predicted RND superfamily exporter protein